MRNSYNLSDQLLPLDGAPYGLTLDSRRMSSQCRLFCEAQASLRSLDPRLPFRLRMIEPASKFR